MVQCEPGANSVPSVTFLSIFIHTYILLNLSFLIFPLHCPLFLHFPSFSNLIMFSLYFLLAMILHHLYCSQYELLICQDVERNSGGRLRHRPDPSLWGSDRNSACWGQRPCTLDILAGHCAFFWAGELYQPNSSERYFMIGFFVGILWIDVANAANSWEGFRSQPIFIGTRCCLSNHMLVC